MGCSEVGFAWMFKEKLRSVFWNILTVLPGISKIGWFFGGIGCFFYRVLLFSEMSSVCFLRGCIGVVLLRLCFPIDCIGVFWYIVLILFLKIVLPFSDKLYCCFLRDCGGVFEQFRYWCFIKDCFYRLQLFFEIFHWCFLKKNISVFSETICIFTKRCFFVWVYVGCELQM